VDTFEKWADLNNCTGSASDAGNATIAWPILKQYSIP